MKFFAFILALFALTLSTFPCLEEVAGSCDTYSSENHQKEEHKELCSAFCSCACCSIDCQLVFQVYENQNISFQETPQLFVYKKLITEGIYSPTWHPPTLV